MPDAKPVLLTTDCGAEMDDQWALAHLALAPEVDLRAVVTTHTGSHPLPDTPAIYTASVARDVLEHLPLDDVPPVVPGSSLPLADRHCARPGPGVDQLLAAAEGFTRETPLTVLAIGAATDLASALLLEPALSGRIEVVAMGFNAWPKGNDPFNVKNDIAAWQVLLDSDVPLTVGDSAVCLSHLQMTPEAAAEQFSGKTGSYIAEIFSSWVGTHGKICKFVTGDERAWPVWDQVTTAHVLGLTSSQMYPRPRLQDDMLFDHTDTGDQKVRWITAVEQERLWAHFAALLI